MTLGKSCGWENDDGAICDPEGVSGKEIFSHILNCAYNYIITFTSHIT